MDLTQLFTNQIIGTIAFFAGVVLLLVELFRNGLSKLSIFSYAGFVLSSIFLSSEVWMCVVAIAGLTILFGVLLRCYKRETRRRQNFREEEDGGKK